MDTSDIEKTKPKILKQNRITNIPDYRIDASDINAEGKKKFISNRVSDPLNPVYRLETVSRRHVMEVGQIEGAAPKLSKSPITRRFTNNLDDIQGSKPKNNGTVPNYVNNQHRSPSSLPPKSSLLPTIPEDRAGI